MNYIELNTLLKIKGLAQTGGKAKQLIRSGAVKVNNSLETRNKRKLVAGDTVTIEGKTWVVTQDICLKE